MMYVFIILCSASASECTQSNADVMARIRVPDQSFCERVAHAIADVGLRAFPNDKVQFACAKEDDA